VQRWGTNVVIPQPPDKISFAFGTGADTAGISSGDSSGPLFILDQSDGVWKFASLITNIGSYIYPNPSGWAYGEFFSTICNPWGWGPTAGNGPALAGSVAWITNTVGVPGSPP
jgi:hypothetical protein